MPASSWPGPESADKSPRYHAGHLRPGHDTVNTQLEGGCLHTESSGRREGGQRAAIVKCFLGGQ